MNVHKYTNKKYTENKLIKHPHKTESSPICSTSFYVALLECMIPVSN